MVRSADDAHVNVRCSAGPVRKEQLRAILVRTPGIGWPMISGIIAVVLETGLCESGDQPVCIQRGDGTSMMSFAASPGTEVEPMWSMRNASSPRPARSCWASAWNSSDQRGDASIIWTGCTG